MLGLNASEKTDALCPTSAAANAAAAAAAAATFWEKTDLNFIPEAHGKVYQ